MSAITSSARLWFASRATGVVALVLLTVAVVLGIAVNRQGRLPGLPGLRRGKPAPRGVAAGRGIRGNPRRHRYRRPIRRHWDCRVGCPFVSHYQPFWLGLGAVSVDLMLALVSTSLVRGRIHPARRDPVHHHAARFAWFAGLGRSCSRLSACT